MIPASQPPARNSAARLLVLTATGAIRHVLRSQFPNFLDRGDLVVANDAATLPASLAGLHLESGHFIEARLATRRSLLPHDVREFSAVLFGEGDHRTRTEDRPLPPVVRPGDRLQFGPLRARVLRLLGHPRLVDLKFESTPAAVWTALAHHGKPIQYAHVPAPLALWDVWTPIAGIPVAFEPPSAGFALHWSLLADLRRRGIAFAALTHAAGISSTGDAALDRRLPLDEPYFIPLYTSSAIERTRARGGRIVAVGTTVVRAIEAAFRGGRVHPGPGLAANRIGPATRLQVVDAILSGTHEPGASHYELLRAFTTDDALAEMSRQLDQNQYRTHEFGDSILVEKMPERALQPELSPDPLDWRLCT